MKSNQHAGLPLVKRIPTREIGSRSPFAGTAIRTSALAIITVSGVWLFMVLLANPVGEFPLNDDWSYSRAVQNLIEHGRLELTGFTSMPLIAQVFWGALFCLPFGFSFTALRFYGEVWGRSPCRIWRLHFRPGKSFIPVLSQLALHSCWRE